MTSPEANKVEMHGLQQMKGKKREAAGGSGTSDVFPFIYRNT